MELKYLIFWVVFGVGVPVGIIACRLFKPTIHLTAIFLVWATAVPETTGINFFSREFYRTATRGLEISLVDLCAIIMGASMLLQPSRFKIRRMPPLLFLHGLLITVALISWSMVGPSLPVPDASGVPPYNTFEVGLYPLFEISKLIRGCLVYWVVLNYLQEKNAMRALMIGFALTVFYMTYLTLADRYIYGIHRVHATLGHANSLATYMAMMGTIMFCFALGTANWFVAGLFAFLTGCAGICVVLTISRGGLMALALGIYVGWMALYRRFFNLKNTLIILGGMIAGGIVLAMAADTLMSRFVGEQDAAEDLEYRGLYNAEAKLMAQEWSWGVGMGNFSAWSWHRYAGMVDPDLPPGTPAHNVWYLTAAELGLPGLVVFAWIWIRFYWLTLPFLWRKGRDLTSVVAVAAVAATLVCHLQSLLQLGYRQTPMYFMIYVLLAAAVAGHVYGVPDKEGRKKNHPG